MLFTITNHSALNIGGVSRPAQIRALPGVGEFDMKRLSFIFDGREGSLDQPYIYDLPEIQAKSTQVIEANIKIPADVGFLLKG